MRVTIRQHIKLLSLCALMAASVLTQLTGCGTSSRKHTPKPAQLPPGEVPSQEPSTVTPDDGDKKQLSDNSFGPRTVPLPHIGRKKVNTNLDQLSILVRDDLLYLTGTTKDSVIATCHSLSDYRSLLNDRGLEFVSGPVNCQKVLDLSIQWFSAASVPADHNNAPELLGHMRGDRRFGINVTDQFPQSWTNEIISRSPGIETNFSVALKTAGLLPPNLPKLSLFSEAAYMLGFIRPFISQNEQSKTTEITYRRPIGRNISNFRTFWEVNSENYVEMLGTEQTPGVIEETVSQYHTPGSLLCFDSKPKATFTKAGQRPSHEQLMKTMKKNGYTIQSNFEQLPEDTIFESPGVHCLTVATPQLTIQSHTFGAKEFLTIRAALLRLTNSVRIKNTTFFYIRTNNLDLQDPIQRSYDTPTLHRIFEATAPIQDFLTDLDPDARTSLLRGARSTTSDVQASWKTLWRNLAQSLDEDQALGNLRNQLDNNGKIINATDEMFPAALYYQQLQQQSELVSKNRALTIQLDY